MKKCDILFCLLHDRIDKDVVAANPKLRHIAAQSISPSNVDVKEATARRIAVTVVPPVTTEATADLNFGLMIAVARRMMEGDRMVRAGQFPGGQSRHLLGSIVWGRIIGLIGGGGLIGKAVARRAHGFGMRVLYWTPRRKPETEEREARLTYVPLDELLSRIRFRVAAFAAHAETRHQIGAREFGLMKKSAFIINTARGPIIDEAALVRALKKEADRRRRPRCFRARAQGSCRSQEDAECRACTPSWQRDRRRARGNGEHRGGQHPRAARRPPAAKYRQPTGACELNYGPDPDRRHRQPVSLARSRQEGAGKARPRVPDVEIAAAEDILAVARDADAVLVTYAKLPGELLSQLTRCKAIGRFGLGVDNIDLPAAKDSASRSTTYRTIACAKCPTTPWRCCWRLRARSRCSNKLVQSGRWEVPPIMPLRRLEGQVLGLIGFGNIPRALAPKAKAFGFKVHDPRSLREAGGA